jgi:RHS repeat-associated protein
MTRQSKSGKTYNNIGDLTLIKEKNIDKMKNRIGKYTKHYYTGNHLSSTQLVTDGTGVAVQQVEYAPFGEVVNEYNIDWSSGQVPDFKFNAKELDEENGMYYFEARYQSPPVFISRDVLFERFPTFSPYSFCYNNPLTFFDPTGKAGLVVVDKEKKTLTVSATYYVVTKGKEGTTYKVDEIAKMQNAINKTLNEQNYKVTSGEYEGYQVVFDLTFKNGGTEKEAELFAKKNNYNFYPIGNVFRKGNSSTDPDYFKEKVGGMYDPFSKTSIGGVTMLHWKIIMNSGADDTRDRIHEIFHTLFFDNDNATEGIGSYLHGYRLPNQDDINMLINNASLEKYNKQKDSPCSTSLEP